MVVPCISIEITSHKRKSEFVTDSLKKEYCKRTYPEVIDLLYMYWDITK